MKKFPRLNFPPHPQRISRPVRGPMRIWDEMRGVWLALTPEEWVRRHVLAYLVTDASVPREYISQEYPVAVSGMPQRADIVVTGMDCLPVMLVECKAPDVGIDAAVYAQAVRYNAVVGARYIMLTNGLVHYVLEKDAEGNYTPCGGIPDMKGYFRKG